MFVARERAQVLHRHQRSALKGQLFRDYSSRRGRLLTDFSVAHLCSSFNHIFAIRLKVLAPVDEVPGFLARLFLRLGQTFPPAVSDATCALRPDIKEIKLFCDYFSRFTRPSSLFLRLLSQLPQCLRRQTLPLFLRARLLLAHLARDIVSGCFRLVAHACRRGLRRDVMRRGSVSRFLRTLPPIDRRGAQSASTFTRINYTDTFIDNRR